MPQHATRATARVINRRLVLEVVRRFQPLSRADVARRLGLRRGMVTVIVDELIANRAIRVGATVDAPRGRRPQMLYVRTLDRLALAVDVRSSRTHLMLSDFSGTALAMETFDSVTDPAEVVAEVAPRIARLLAEHRATGRCEGIGLVIPGMVDHQTGRVLNAPQLGWKNVDFRDRLAAATGLPVYIENAPIACALAQLWLGQRGETGPTDFVYVTVSDGVGAAVVVNGEVVRGAGNTAGEFGHIPLNIEGPRCLCGAQGCLESYTSNLATLSRYLGHEFSPTETRTLLQSSAITIEDLIARARADDLRARDAIDETARFLGLGLAVIINAVNPSQIFVGGEITAAWDRIEPTLRAAIGTRVLTQAAEETPIIPDPAAAYPRLRGGTALVAAREFAAPRVA
jgi:predicted NBD/HSP70 family sugar kinase